MDEEEERAQEERSVSLEELSQDIEVLCASKAEEFRMIGYEHVVGEEIWSCVSSKYAKSGQPPLYQLVNDILSLKPTAFMNFMTLSAYRGTHF
ncbi:post-transcriptional regulator [Paenibacillus sabuli]|uniref:post-transcriptional regulator n=1 Tax=Paenibacillus sabuli TaxID=2772509 RepID=UPI00295BC20C|nr:post-transcriptional regulator [Paenibacillus sabuli]